MDISGIPGYSKEFKRTKISFLGDFVGSSLD